MTQYLWAPSHNVALVDLLPIDPQPSTIGWEYTREQYAASGIVIQEAPFVRMNWSMLESTDQYQDLLDQIDLMTDITAPISVYLQDERYNWVLRNAVAVLPLIGSQGSRNNYFLRDFTILLKNLQAQP